MKIGIFYYPTIFSCWPVHLHKREENIRKAIRDYCLKHNLDDAIPVAFKATDFYMRCRNFPYRFGRNEDSLKVRPLELCDRGLHFCGDLGSVFDFYSFKEFDWPSANTRYFIAFPEGFIRYSVNKMCSNVLNILKEIPRDMTEEHYAKTLLIKYYGCEPRDVGMSPGLYDLVNDAVNEFIANNKDGNDYVNLISYSEGGD